MVNLPETKILLIVISLRKLFIGSLLIVRLYHIVFLTLLCYLGKNLSDDPFDLFMRNFFGNVILVRVFIVTLFTDFLEARLTIGIMVLGIF